ncbi:protein eyes shut-like protein [Platysternon megacephalum]|uniref:Protein eyes shut-like protein n=1 Tax=Platysternon megacephalum TaxID=55544 RepID=A0A4D9E2F9_9SAUR|nr:protein eyes shut-like protein [Platysternon megacephalum]
MLVANSPAPLLIGCLVAEELGVVTHLPQRNDVNELWRPPLAVKAALATSHKEAVSSAEEQQWLPFTACQTPRGIQA